MSGCNPVHDIKNLIKKSERQDLNLRPLPPQGSTLPSCATSRFRHLYRVVFSWLLALNGSTGKAQRLDRSPSARNPLPRPDFIKFSFNYYFFYYIGMTRFELATPATRTRCATRLRYIPTILNFQMFYIFKSALPPLGETIHRIVSLGRVLHPDILLFCSCFFIISPQKKIVSMIAIY